jgi:hypothetical protein
MMNYSQQPGQYLMYNYRSANDNLASPTGQYPMYDYRSANDDLASPTGQYPMYNYSSANDDLASPTDLNRDGRVPVPEIDSGPARNLLPSAVRHHGCAYTLRSWLPEFFGCFFGILALIGQTGAPLRVPAS